MAKQIILTAIFLSDGTLDKAATDKEYFELRDKLAAEVQEDFDTVAVDVTSFLLTVPGLKTIPTSALVRALWEQKIEAGALKGKTQDEKSAMYARLEEIVPEYVKSNSDMFHMGRKTGIAVRYVPGEEQKDAKGNTVYDGEANPVQHYRHTDEEWAKLTTPKAKPAAENTNGNAAAAQ